VYCEDCPRWDSEKRKCRDGKLNPQTWTQAFEVAGHIGLRAICVFNDHRERLVKSRANQVEAKEVKMNDKR
jgi:hypothetical protein